MRYFSLFVESIVFCIIELFILVSLFLTFIFIEKITKNRKSSKN